MPDPQNPNPPADGDSSGNNPPDHASATQNPPATSSVDVDTAITKALAKQEASFKASLKEATGFDSLQDFTKSQLEQDGKLKELADANAQQANQYKQQFEQAAIKNAFFLAANQAVDPETVQALLAPKAVVGADGSVTVDGKAVDVAVNELLKAKPHLAKASGNQGSGAANTPPPQDKTMTHDEFNKLDTQAQFKFIRSGGSLT